MRMYTRILTVNERKRVETYLVIDGERSAPIRQLVARSKRYLPDIENDLALIRRLLESDSNRRVRKPHIPTAPLPVTPPPSAPPPIQELVVEEFDKKRFAEYCYVCGTGIFELENYCNKCGTLKDSIQRVLRHK